MLSGHSRVTPPPPRAPAPVEVCCMLYASSASRARNRTASSAHMEPPRGRAALLNRSDFCTHQWDDFKCKPWPGICRWMDCGIIMCTPQDSGENSAKCDFSPDTLSRSAQGGGKRRGKAWRLPCKPRAISHHLRDTSGDPRDHFFHPQPLGQILADTLSSTYKCCSEEE